MTLRVQIDDTVRDATPDEAVQIQAHAAASAAVADAKAATLASARTKLAALGLTDAEIVALIRG